MTVNLRDTVLVTRKDILTSNLGVTRYVLRQLLRSRRLKPARLTRPVSVGRSKSGALSPGSSICFSNVPNQVQPGSPRGDPGMRLRPA